MRRPKLDDTVLATVEHGTRTPYHPVVTTSFGTWYPLAEAGAHAPAEPGVYQLRVRQGLVDYPTGKSAMIHYGAATDLRTAVTELAQLHHGRSWLCRHMVDVAPDGLLARLLQRFEQRFGTPPMLPS